uniref:Uncharacterized protein n=1 Tax=Panagrolaimus sp. PS1159 TaxID=55785 RepID=A0AC35FI37_9BILA
MATKTTATTPESVTTASTAEPRLTRAAAKAAAAAVAAATTKPSTKVATAPTAPTTKPSTAKSTKAKATVAAAATPAVEASTTTTVTKAAVTIKPSTKAAIAPTEPKTKPSTAKSKSTKAKATTTKKAAAAAPSKKASKFVFKIGLTNTKLANLLIYFCNEKTGLCFSRKNSTTAYCVICHKSYKHNDVSFEEDPTLHHKNAMDKPCQWSKNEINYLQFDRYFLKSISGKGEAKSKSKYYLGLCMETVAKRWGDDPTITYNKYHVHENIKRAVS